MWESWELIQAKPLIKNKNKNGLIEPPIEDMNKLFSNIPIQKGYSIGVQPIVLPVSLEQFNKIFIDDSAPYFLDKLLAETGNTILQVDSWQPI